MGKGKSCERRCDSYNYTFCFSISYHGDNNKLDMEIERDMPECEPKIRRHSVHEETTYELAERELKAEEAIARKNI